MPCPHRREHEVRMWEPCLALRMFKCVCLYEESTQEPEGQALRNAAVPLAGEYLAGMDKKPFPLFPQHLKPAEKTAVTDKSLPTGQREIAKAAHTVKSSVPSVNSVCARVRSLSFSPSRALPGWAAPCVGIHTSSGSGSLVSYGLCLS